MIHTHLFLLCTQVLFFTYVFPPCTQALFFTCGAFRPAPGSFRQAQNTPRKLETPRIREIAKIAMPRTVETGPFLYLPMTLSRQVR